MRHFHHPHTAYRVLEGTNVLQSWGIDELKISKVPTDNGLNIVAAFKNTIYNLDSDLEVAEAIPGTSDDDIDEQLITSSDLEQNDDTQDIEDHNLVLMEKNAEDEIAEFKKKELNYSLMFSSHFSRVSCLAHTLQLIARKFDTITSVKKVLTKAYCLVAKFYMSSKATEKLIQQASKKLRANCPTRWSSTFLVVSRIL